MGWRERRRFAMNMWFDIHHVGLAFGTIQGNQSIIDCNIKPIMAGKRMLEIKPKPKHIDAVMAGVAHKSESIYKATYTILKQVFTSAYNSHDILANPCPSTRKGGIPPKERIPLTDEQIQTLLHVVKETIAYPFCMLALYAGLRREEILARRCTTVGRQPKKKSR